ncbi:MAG: hypothetical protein DHS20C11_10530 [Lysobacteraceae bacterium]|nr:MAG: hypothetical protein DHS20C11_10530 [Xanthomonadaceae bacterium]
MKLSFPKSKHKDVEIGTGKIRIGASADNEVCLQADGIRDNHLAISNDRRGLVLTLEIGAENTYLNGRPIREKAILRLGDHISMGDISIVLREDEGLRKPPPDDDEPVTEKRTVHRACLRGVSGSYFGKVIPIFDTVTIGRSASCEVVLAEPELSRRHAQIRVTPDGLVLRDLGSANGTFVNGNRVRDARLHQGDQIAFDLQRFVVEAPGYIHSTPPPMPVNADPVRLEASTLSLRDRLIVAVCVLLSMGLLVFLLLRIS